MKRNEQNATEKIELKDILKIPYFDESAAQDYLDIKNGGHLDWSSDENKEKIAKIIGEIEAEVGGGINILSALKATFQGKGGMEYSSAVSKLVDSKLTNTILTDYLTKANADQGVKKFKNVRVYPYPNSFTMYKLFSSYLTVVPKEQMPIDMEKFNQALLGERGYYELIAEGEDEEYILRFNVEAFRNGYNLTDLSKMKLIYYGIPVGKLAIANLGIDKEFEYMNSQKSVSAEEVLGTEEKGIPNESVIYDIVIAGVPRE